MALDAISEANRAVTVPVAPAVMVPRMSAMFPVVFALDAFDAAGNSYAA